MEEQRTVTISFSPDGSHIAYDKGVLLRYNVRAATWHRLIFDIRSGKCYLKEQPERLGTVLLS
jgi:nitrite reductase/ring-hydroxylating ferredoxin subunit